MIITLTNLKKRHYGNISLKPLYCKAFRLLKIEFLALFYPFSPYFRTTTNIPYNKKTQKPLRFLRFKALTFFSIKTDNALILYKVILIIYAVSFAMAEGVKLTIFTYKCVKTVKKGLPESLINKGF